MKTAIVGAGAMGQLFGARLQLSGADVVFIDTNQATIDALNAGGVTLHTESRTEHIRARAARASDLDEVFELFIIFTKGFHTQAAVASIAHLIGTESYGLTLQNGLGNAECLQEYFGASKTLLGVTDFPADMPAPGVVSSNGSGKVRIGALGKAPRLPEITSLLDSANLHTVVEQDIRIPVWEKVAFNAALNTLSAVTGLTVGGIGADPHARGLVASVLEETMAVAGRLKIDVSRQRIETALDNAYAHHTHHKTSMLIDREAGRPTEVDMIGGAVAQLGREHGIDTPVLEGPAVTAPVRPCFI